MDFYGNINLLNNEMQQMVFNTETDFPASPKIGRMVFKGQKLYICVDLNGILPIWVPLTNTISMYTENVTVASTTWIANHNLSASNPVVQVYDSNDSLIIPDSVIATDSSTVTVTLSQEITGKIVVLKSDEMPANGAGILAPDSYSYTKDFISESTIVVTHNLGYYPIVRAYVNNSEIQPLNIIHDSIFQTTVSFDSALTGTLRFV